MRRYLEQYEYFLCSFPPSIGLLFIKLANSLGKRMILNVAHRFNIGVDSPRKNREVLSMIEEVHSSNHHVLFIMSDYDYHYIRYYLGIEPVHLHLSCFHIPLKCSHPSKPEILVGPAHVKNLGPFQSEDDMNKKMAQLSINRAEKPLFYSHMKGLYPNYEFNQLQRHPAVVLFPYSAFSISMAELYELNIPMFVPSNELLIKHGQMTDRTLFPIYCTESQFSAFETEPKCGDFGFSPNNNSAKAQDYWLEYCYFNNRENIVTWNSPEDLSEKLSGCDLQSIREKMFEENGRIRVAVKRNWRQFFLQNNPAS
jgi:hypothetical protein